MPWLVIYQTLNFLLQPEKTWKHWVNLIKPACKHGNDDCVRDSLLNDYLDNSSTNYWFYYHRLLQPIIIGVILKSFNAKFGLISTLLTNCNILQQTPSTLPSSLWKVFEKHTPYFEDSTWILYWLNMIISQYFADVRALHIHWNKFVSKVHRTKKCTWSK